MSNQSATKAKGSEQQIKKSRPQLYETDAWLDFSFCDLTALSDLHNVEPRPQAKKKVEKVRVEVDAPTEDDPDRKEEKFLYKSTILKVNNNELADISNLIPTLDDLLLDTMAVTWLDLTSNALTKIDPAICDLRNLKILYLAANEISDMQEVKKLAGLPKLKKLSLHVNPIASQPNYRKLTLGLLGVSPDRSCLECLDGASITKADKANAKTFSSFYPPKAKGKKKRED